MVWTEQKKTLYMYIVYCVQRSVGEENLKLVICRCGYDIYLRGLLVVIGIVDGAADE